MTDWTGTQIQQENARLEHETALAIGRFIIEFCRLEMALGLAIAWKNGGSELKQQTEKTSGESFGARLERLRKHIDSLPSDQAEASASYYSWIGAAAELREVRNQFIHGRWGIRAVDGDVSNVIGLPTSPGQHEVFYKTSELNAQVQRVIRLRDELSGLRKKWPWL